MTFVNCTIVERWFRNGDHTRGYAPGTYVLASCMESNAEGWLLHVFLAVPLT